MIRPRACWGAACDLLGMSVVYPAGGTVTISKKSPLIRILSKGRDCIDFEKNVKTRLCRGRRPRRPAEGSTLGGAQRAPPVRFANPLVRLFAPQGQTLLAPRFRFAQPWPRARNPATLPCKSIEKWGCGHKLAGRHARPLQEGAFEVAMKTIYRFCTFPGSW